MEHPTTLMLSHAVRSSLVIPGSSRYRELGPVNYLVAVGAV